MGPFDLDLYGLGDGKPLDPSRFWDDRIRMDFLLFLSYVEHGVPQLGRFFSRILECYGDTAMRGRWRR